MMSQLKYCDDRSTPKELLLSGHLVKNDSIQSQIYKESSKIINKCNSYKKQRSIMLESVQNINKITLNDKLKISDSTTRNTKLLVHQFRAQLETQFCCHFKINTHRRNQESSSYPKGFSLIIYLL